VAFLLWAMSFLGMVSFPIALLAIIAKYYILFHLYDLDFGGLVALWIIDLLLSPVMWALRAFAEGLVAFVAL